MVKKICCILLLITSAIFTRCAFADSPFEPNYCQDSKAAASLDDSSARTILSQLCGSGQVMQDTLVDQKSSLGGPSKSVFQSLTQMVLGKGNANQVPTTSPETVVNPSSNAQPAAAQSQQASPAQSAQSGIYGHA